MLFRLSSVPPSLLPSIRLCTAAAITAALLAAAAPVTHAQSETCAEERCAALRDGANNECKLDAKSEECLAALEALAVCESACDAN